MLIPGLSTENKLIIQKKLDKILNKEYTSPCQKFIKQINKFNDKVAKNLTNEKLIKLNAKLSKNFYLKRNPHNKLKLILNIEGDLPEFEHVKKAIYKSFTINELIILFNNLDYFIKDEKIRKIFPKLKNGTFHPIYSKDITKQNSIKRIKPKLNLVSPLQDDKNKNKVNNGYFLKKEKINKILSCFNKKVKKEKKDILKKELKDIIQKNFYRKTMNKMNYDLNNISRISNSKEFSFEHPLVNFYFDQKKKKCKTGILNYKSNSIHNTKFKNQNLYKNIINENKNMLSFIKNIEDNLLTNRITEKNITHRRVKEIASLTKRFNNDFRLRLYNLRKNNSNNSCNFDNSNNYIKFNSGRDYNSFNLG